MKKNHILTTFFLLTISFINAQNVFVDPINGNDSNSGVDWSTAKKTIMNAIWNTPNINYNGSTEDIFVYVKEGTAVETPNDYESPDGLTFAPAGLALLYTTVPANKNITVQGSIDTSATGSTTGTCGYIPPVISLDHVTRVTLSDINQQGLFRLFGNSGNLTLKGLYYFDFDGALENFGSVIGARDTYSNKTITMEDCVIDDVRTGVSKSPIEFIDNGVKENTINFKNCIFRNNPEGVFRQYSDANTWNIENCKFDNNKQYGTFSQFQMETSGLTPSTLSIKNSTFCGNKTNGANQNPGMINLFGSGGWICIVENNTFYNNLSRVGGGAIKAVETELTLIGNTFAQNETSNRGGAVRLDDCTLTSSNNKFQSNKANQLTEGYGGAVYISGIKTGASLPAFTFDGDEFHQNTATQDGGAVYIIGQTSSTSPHITFNNCKFGYNTADNGGAIKSFADISIVNAIFHANKADNGLGGGLGGAIDSRNSGTNISSSCFYENYAVDGGSALYVNDNGATDTYFSVPSGYSTSNNATKVRHISYQNGFYTNQSGYSGSILGDDGVIGGAVVYSDVRGTASADDKGGNVAFIANKVFNNVTYYDKTGANQYNSVVGSGFTVRGLALSSDGDNVVAFQDNEFAGNTIGGATGVQSATEDKVDVSITNSDGNLSNYDGAIFNVDGTKFQLTESQYPTLQNPNTADWEGIIDNNATISISGDIDDTSGIGLLWDIEEVNITGSAVFSSNQVHGGDIFNQISIPNPTTLSTGAEWRAGSGSDTYDNNGNWSFTDTRTSIDKNYTIEMISGGISTVLNVNVPALPSNTYSFNNTDTSGLQACSLTTTLLTECPTSPIVETPTPKCFCSISPNTTGTSLETKHGITSLKRAGASNGNWPMVRKGAWTALESKTKGFVITRIDNIAVDTAGNPGQATSITNPQNGMIIYDIVNKCLKIYDGTQWSCFSTPGCPTP